MLEQYLTVGNHLEIAVINCGDRCVSVTLVFTKRFFFRMELSFMNYLGFVSYRVTLLLLNCVAFDCGTK